MTIAQSITNQALQKVEDYLENGQVEEARRLHQNLVHNLSKNELSQKSLTEAQEIKTSPTKDLEQKSLEPLITLYNKGQLDAVAEQTLILMQSFPNAFALWNIYGFANKGLGRIKVSELSFRNATRLNPNYPEGYTNLGIVLRAQGKLKEALETYNEAIKLKPDYADAYNNIGNALKEQGKLKEAEEAYKKALSLEPDFAEAYNNIGNINQDQGKLEEAVEAYNTALSFNPNLAEAHNNLGNTLKKQGKLEESIESYKKAVSFKKDYVEVFYNMGNALKDQNKPKESIKAYKKAINLKADYVDAYNNLGTIFQAQGESEEALQMYRQAISIKPGFADAHNNMGNALLGLGELEKSVKAFKKAISIKPDFADAYNNMGNVFHNKNELEKAIGTYNKALSLKPDFADAYNSMGNAFYDQGKIDKAIEAYNKALILKPGLTDSYNNIGLSLQEQGKLKEAEEAFLKVLSLDPSNAKASFNLSLLYNLQGNLKVGFELYESRTKIEDVDVEPARQEFTWDGLQDLQGKNVLVYEEQGLGDVIQFCRYLALLKEKGATVTFKVTSNLHQLLKSLDARISFTNIFPKKNQIDFEVPLMSLPYFFGTNLETIPMLGPYLYADKHRIKYWSEKFNRKGKNFKVGICWQGKEGKVDIGRSFPLSLFENIAKLPNVELISLQKGHGEDQLADSSFPITTFGSNFDLGKGAFIDTAAIMMNCDLIITSDTAIAHLSGALGQPTWVALKYIPEWRWLMNRNDSPWYSTMSLYRQKKPGDWVEVFNRIEEDLYALTEEKGK